MPKIKHNQKKSRLPNQTPPTTKEPKPSLCFFDYEETVMVLKDIPHDFFRHTIRQCKLLSSLTWNEIYRHDGLGWDEVPESNMKFKIPSRINRKELHHIKVSRRGRIWGYREGNSFHVVWFDPDHQVTPER